MPAECCIATQLGSYAIDFLRIDTRPTFIVSVSTEYSAKDQSGTVLFVNDALRDLERVGEISMEWVLNEAFLSNGGGTFSTNRWRFTSVAIGGGKEEIVMVVTAASIPALEWDSDASANGVKKTSPAHGIVDRKGRAQIDFYNANRNGYKDNATDSQPESNSNGISKAPVTLLEAIFLDYNGEGGMEHGGKEEGDTEDLVSSYSSPTRTEFQRFSTLPQSKTQVTPQVPKSFLDRTQAFSDIQTSEHYRNFRNVDWSKTDCGHFSTWPLVLRLVVNSMMTTPCPMAFYWGPEYTILYNEGWRTIAQNKDPELLGKRFAEGWPEVKNYFLPLLDAAYFHGKAANKESQQLFLNREDMIEEGYYNISIYSVANGDGTPGGVIEQAFDQTRQVISARRMATLQRMGELLGSVKDLDEDDFWRILHDAFDDNPLDSPFILIYKAVNEDKSRAEFPTSGEFCLEHNTGFPEGSYLAPQDYKLGEDCGYFSGEMKLAGETNSVVLKKLDLDTMEDSNRIVYRGFEDTPKFAVVIPIQATKTATQGFLILGLNARRPYDEDYKLWINLLKKELATAAGRVMLLKNEIAKAISEETQRVAKIQAVQLQEQLQKRTAELRDSELLFTGIAETIPVGLGLINKDGEVFFTNDAYLKLGGLTKDSDTQAWRESIYHEDRARVYESYEKVIKSAIPMQWETRIGSDPSNPQGWRYWITCSIVPQTKISPSGEEKLLGFILTIVDITSIKLNEEYQRQLSTQAVERRRQQENFIDVFSHELRNPFSATLQCADGILNALMEFQNNEKQERGLDVEDIIDSASTILVCVQHQMRIIDDVLTLSKLDSMLLSVVPVDVQIHETVSQIIKIFQSELNVKGISLQYLLEDSYKELAIDWVKADPSRFSQILMNLITNAIKFTSLQAGKREIITRLGASLERPTGHGVVVYRKGDQVRLPQDVSHSDWGTGEIVYILITVQDSGIGISDEWQKKLFKRFEQVPRTHVTYGGSGLGLFICRQLCRIQGGEIGVYSEEGHGSSFSFYIRARRSTGPPNTPQASPHTPPTLERRMSKFEEITTRSGEVGVVAMKTYPVSKVLDPGISGREQLSYNVLIVEDNLINQEVLRRQLRKEGCGTYVAGNGEEALKVISESVFVKEGGIGIDIVLMDMEMPVMDGNTATLKIREMERSRIVRRHVPIIGISANARPEQVAKMTKAGMDDAISKPFRIADLLMRFDNLLRKLQECRSANLLNIPSYVPDSTENKPPAT